MKKLVIASAVASVLATGAAVADTTMGGNIRILLQNQGEMAVNSNKLTFDVKASEDLGNGMTAIARLELENDRTDNETTGWSNDLSYVGLKGDFGTVVAGVHDDAAGFACGATDIFTSNSGNACGVGSTNGPLDNAVVYVGGFDAVTLVVGLTFDGDLASGEFTDGGAAGAQPAGGNHQLVAVNFDGGAFSVGGQITMPDDEVTDDSWTVIGGTVKLGEGTLGLTFADSGADDMNTAVAVAFAMPMAGGTAKIGIDQGEALEDADGNDSILNVEYDASLGKSAYWGVQFSDDDRQEDSLIQGIFGYKF
jgi:predicted porin